MFDCNKELIDFYNNEVALSQSQQDEMRQRRNANRDRLKKGLEKNEKPLPDEHIPQGSYAMHTMVQDDNNDYDIDDGAAFLKAVLVGAQGAELSALDARKMVRDALDDGSFENPPEVRKNCVRVYYKAGYHVDIPVYRKLDDGTVELASSAWVGSSPTDVSEWYNKAVIAKSPDLNNGRQMRRITRHLKMFKGSRGSWKAMMPSGFEVSVLVDECYVSNADRDDVALYDTMLAIWSRLNTSLEVRHPTRGEMLTDGPGDANTRMLRDKLAEALKSLEILHASDCTRLDALKAWNWVFNHDYWKNQIAEEEEAQKRKEEKADRLRHGNSGLAKKAGLASAGAGCGVMKDTRAFGGKLDDGDSKKCCGSRTKR